jgi:hypothetical protein|nr:MAG TPA: major capsid protein [Caudoviricetes sp.]
MNLSEQIVNLKALRKATELKENAGEKPRLSSKAIATYEMAARNLMGDYSQGKVSVSESLTSTDAIKMIPKIIEGQLREASEPEYLGTRFMHQVNVEGSNNSAVYVIPVVGELIASEVNEGGRYNEDQVEFNTIENSQLEVRVKKIGLKVSVTEEAISDSSWDIMGINIRKMGRAMARYKEEWIFNTFSTHGHTIFDNEIREQIPEAGTTGYDQNGEYNDTLSVEDFIDIVLALMSNGFNPTDVIMHPLVWLVFARNSMIGNGLTFGALGGQNVHQWGQIQGTPGFAGLSANGEGQKYILRPEQVQNRLPMPLTVNFSPFVSFDKINKKFDMYCLDRTEVGVIVQKENLSTENWTDPERDLRNLKCKERYGIGILNSGKAITVAKNIAVAPSYPQAPVIKIAQ